MLAVLPFENLSGDPQQEYFSDGMTLEMISRLGSLQPERLGVIARISSMRYKATNKPLDQIARELGVQYLIEGSVRRAADQVRITAQLIQASDQTYLWAENYVKPITDVFAVQSDVADRVAAALALKLLPGRRAAWTRSYTTNPKAYDLYLQGHHSWSKFTLDGLQDGIKHFQQAIDLDPAFALAYSGLADCYTVLGINYLAPAETFPKAKEAALKALELDDTLAEVHASLGAIHIFYDWDWPGAGEQVRRAIEISSSLAAAHQVYSYCLEAMGRPAEAMAEITLARNLDPLSPLVILDIGIRHYNARQYDQAIETYLKVYEADPLVHYFLLFAYERKGMYDQAIREYRNMMSLGGDQQGAAALADAYARLGYRAALKGKIETVKRLVAGRHFFSPEDVAAIYAFLGENDQAFKWLEKAYQDRASRLFCIKVDARFDSLRSDPRFQALLRKMNLEPSSPGIRGAK